jgi:hypothetical protein
MTLARIEEAFEAFDLAMDETLDEVQDPAMQGAIVAGLAVRLVQYQLGSHLPHGAAEAIAVSLAGQLASLKRDIMREAWEG